MMKFNWGTGIAIVIGIFLLSMALFIYKSFQQKFPLVEQEYYPKGLEYDKMAERIKNTAKLSEKFRIEQSGNQVIINQPSILLNEASEGNILFYRPSDDAGDFSMPIVVDSSLCQKVSTAKLLEGKYLVKINWKSSGKEYYQEETIYITH